MGMIEVGTGQSSMKERACQRAGNVDHGKGCFVLASQLRALKPHAPAHCRILRFEGIRHSLMIVVS